MSATAATAPATPPAADAIPGPAGHPLLGMARALRNDLLGTLQDGFAQHGDIVAHRVGSARGPQRLRAVIVAVRHPDDARRVLHETDVFVRTTPAYAVMRELLGETIVTMDGAPWRRRKRILQPLFTRQNVARYADLLEVEAQRVVASWRPFGDQPVDVAQAMEQYALRVLGQTIFAAEHGIDADTVAALERLVPQLGSQVVGRVTQLVRPPLRWPTPRNRDFLALRAELRAMIERVLARREAEGLGGDAGADDLLSCLRAASDPDEGATLTQREVRDEALLFLLAGHTTTADVLTSTLHLLGRNPEVQEQVAAAAASEAAAGDDDLVGAAVQESMRLHPPSYVISRRTASDTELGGHAVPAGTLVLLVPWVTHRDPRFWSDPERFDPTRFVGEQPRRPFAYMPFGGGGRICIGRHLAMQETTVLLRALLRSYRLESIEATIPLSAVISMRPAGPVLVRFQPREPVGAVA